MHIRKQDRDALKGLSILMAEGLRIAWKDARGKDLTAADEKRLKAAKKRARDLGVS